MLHKCTFNEVNAHDEVSQGWLDDKGKTREDGSKVNAFFLYIAPTEKREQRETW